MQPLRQKQFFPPYESQLLKLCLLSTLASPKAVNSFKDGNSRFLGGAGTVEEGSAKIASEKLAKTVVGEFDRTSSTSYCDSSSSILMKVITKR